MDTARDRVLEIRRRQSRALNKEQLLRRQVKSEVRKKQYVFYTLALLSLLYICVGLIFGDSGYIRYRELKARQAALQSEVKETGRQNEMLNRYLNTLKKNDFYGEKNARENFGLAKPDEYIFLYEK